MYEYFGSVGFELTETEKSGLEPTFLYFISTFMVFWFMSNKLSKSGHPSSSFLVIDFNSSSPVASIVS